MPGTGISAAEIATHARETAAVIRRLPNDIKEIIESNPWPTVADVKQRLSPTKFEIDFANVALYVGRHWSLDHQDRLLIQIAKIGDGVRAFIEQFEHCQQGHDRQSTVFDRKELGFFAVCCLMIATVIDQWAHDIKAKAEVASQQAEPAGGGKSKPSKKPVEHRQAELTKREKEVLKTYSDCGRSFVEAGKELGVTKQYVEKVVKNSRRKLKSKRATQGCSGANQKLPAGRDGEELVSEERGASDKGTGRKLRVKRKF